MVEDMQINSYAKKEVYKRTQTIKFLMLYFDGHTFGF